MHLLATYGTLKKGHSNSYLLDKAKYIGHGTTVDKFTMAGLMVYQQPATAKVVIDLWEVDDNLLKGAIDRLEGHPYSYMRRKTMVEVDGKEHEAWLYFYPDEKVEPDPARVRHLNKDGHFEWGVAEVKVA